jgi:glycolate oxidase iron-sulfur subunit
MESFFREINFAAVRVLTANGFQVCVPEGQVCCGAVLEHNGLPGKERLDEINYGVFKRAGVDVVLSNSAGCGLSLQKALQSKVEDAIYFLNASDLIQGGGLDKENIYLDLPCHLYHGRKVRVPPGKVMDSLGVSWALTPEVGACCGSGGTYNITHPENSKEIIKARSDFLNHLPYTGCTLAALNHVCMMQWNSSLKLGLVSKKVRVSHVIQLLDESYNRGGIYSGL